LAATEVLRRRSAVALRRQLVRAERNVERKDYERSLAEYDRAIAAAPTDVPGAEIPWRSEEHTSELQSRFELVCRPLLEKKNTTTTRFKSSMVSATTLLETWIRPMSFRRP